MMDNRKKHENNPWDALGAETAIEHDMEFVPRDENLCNALAEYSKEHLLRYEDYKQFVEDTSG